MLPTHKRCTSCGEIRALEDFSKGIDPHGRKYMCKTCAAQATREWRARPGNKSRYQQANRRSRLRP